jgi:CheY-like chemotaxis protein
MVTPKPRPAFAGRSFALVLRRALEAELQPEDAARVVREAMRMAEVDDVPVEPAGFMVFVLGSLDVAVERKAGREAADRVLEHLEPLLDMARERVKASAVTSGVAPKSLPEMPAVRDEGPLTESGVHPRITPATRPELPEPAPQATILVCSADPKLREWLRRELQGAGHRVVAAHDGHVGLALTVRYSPALVICDREMPRVSGKELVSSLDLALGSNIPDVIMLVEGAVDQESPTGVFLQVPKPVHPEVLQSLVDAALQPRRD